MTDGVLRNLDRITLRTSDGDLLGYDIVAFEKRVSDGVIVLHGPAGRMLTIDNGTAASRLAVIEGWQEYGHDVTTMTTPVKHAMRRSLLVSHRGRVLMAESAAGSVSSTNGNNGALVPAAPLGAAELLNTLYPDFGTTPAWLEDGCAFGTNAGRTGDAALHKCECLKRRYWSNSKADDCGARPAGGGDPCYAYRGESCSDRPCYVRARRVVHFSRLLTAAPTQSVRRIFKMATTPAMRSGSETLRPKMAGIPTKARRCHRTTRCSSAAAHCLTKRLGGSGGRTTSTTIGACRATRTPSQTAAQRALARGINT